ncbi:hypothetical protein AWC38_SpisGene16166 [Stylophora pistillata]|uniref:Uncharacterized protein n=1 Tax=Stylophora pistillata TaxID=50429 RepID=A0A2B4RT75_STYPI|nr:hypothetical protein AWC38_SpisGene16166 [Stylophora pistillata]
MARKVILSVYLLLAISTEELMARNLFRDYREMRTFAKRSSGCDLLGAPCALCDTSALCEGVQLACYGGQCDKDSSNSYKKKRSVLLTKDF